LQTLQKVSIGTAVLMLSILVGIMAFPQPPYRIARAVTVIFMLAIVVVYFSWLQGRRRPTIERRVLGGLAAIVVLVGCPCSVSTPTTGRWVTPCPNEAGTAPKDS
jgi:hypothetical protein